jgi:hypothetical protein
MAFWGAYIIQKVFLIPLGLVKEYFKQYSVMTI